MKVLPKGGQGTMSSQMKAPPKEASEQGVRKGAHSLKQVRKQAIPTRKKYLKEAKEQEVPK